MYFLLVSPHACVLVLKMLFGLIVRRLSSKCKCTVSSSFLPFSGPAAAERHLCPTRAVWLHPPAASSSGTTARTCRRPPGGRSHHRMQQLVTSCFFNDIFSLIVACTPQVTSCYCLFCSAAFATMGLCSVTRESVKVREQSGKDFPL